MALFKPLLGKRENLPTVLTSGYAYFCIDDGSFWIDYKDSDGVVKRKQINAQEAEKIIGYEIVATLTDNDATIPVSSAVFSAIESAKNDLNTELSGRIDDVENDIKTINEELENISQDFEDYQTTNNDVVAVNSSNIERNKAAIAVIQGDYLTSTDRTQLQDNITQVSNKAIENTSAIEILNGDGVGSVKHSIDNAFNEFATNLTNDDVVNTYKELIDYAATHGPEFVTLVGEVDTINTHIGEVESDFVDYKTEVEERFTEVDTVINNHASDANNPHGVTKEQIGLANVDDTSDIEKPISYATQEALDGKADTEHTHDDLYYTKDELLAMLELITVEDIDNICGMIIEIASEGLSYKLNSNKTSYSVSGIGTCTDTNVFIPKTYNDLPVTNIGVSAFGECTNLISVDIPGSVTSIGLGAFGNCTSLTSVTIHSGVTGIGAGAFDTCTSLTSITIPSSVTSIGMGAFYNCNKLTNVTFNGTKDQWDAISIYDNNECLTNATISYAQNNGGSHD